MLLQPIPILEQFKDAGLDRTEAASLPFHPLIIFLSQADLSKDCQDGVVSAEHR